MDIISYPPRNLWVKIRVSAGDWHHYGYVKSGTTLTLYLDGTFVVSDACPATHSLVGTELAFGSYRIQNAKDGLYIYKGLIDEARIYNRALSEDEVKKNFVAKGFTAVSPTKKLAETWGEVKGSR
ncbi:LamG domain-containing protein [Candidatus Poribacteria bacterium]|nr:LamG domain-containing protein [Candidatus Poribacteria bacterium]